MVDADGFQLVVNRRQLRSEVRRARPPPPQRRSVPADLVGRCFNCLSFGHVAARCTFPSRCLRCEREGHSARNCKRGRSAWPRNHGRPVRRIGTYRDVAAAPFLGRYGRSAASDFTVSSGSASSGRHAVFCMLDDSSPGGAGGSGPGDSADFVAAGDCCRVVGPVVSNLGWSLGSPFRFGQLRRGQRSVLVGPRGAAQCAHDDPLLVAALHSPSPASGGPRVDDFDPMRAEASLGRPRQARRDKVVWPFLPPVEERPSTPPSGSSHASGLDPVLLECTLLGPVDLVAMPTGPTEQIGPVAWTDLDTGGSPARCSNPASVPVSSPTTVPPQLGHMDLESVRFDDELPLRSLATLARYASWFGTKCYPFQRVASGAAH